MARPSEIAYYSNHSFSAELVDLFLDDCEQDSSFRHPHLEQPRQ